MATERPFSSKVAPSISGGLTGCAKTPAPAKNRTIKLRARVPFNSFMRERVGPKDSQSKAAASRREQPA
jgi:hypothetical protein